jgi:REP element-mobilizing transposase RayT
MEGAKTASRPAKKPKRPLKRHVQQNFRYRDRNGQKRGGKREGAGRPAKGPRSSEKHKARPKLNGRHPVLVTVRVVREVGNLRKRHIYRAMRFALYSAANRDDFRVVHFSIQHNHLHLIVEAANQRAMSRGMQGLLISAARHVNMEIEARTGERRRGRVVADRYHARVLNSPKQCRNALSYVLNNWRRHEEDRAAVASGWTLDPFSSAVNFGGWKELEDSPFLFPVRETYERLHTCTPQTWLLRTGWTKHGLIGAREVPGPAPS